MTSPYQTGTVTEFPLSGNGTIDAFINWGFKWGAGGVGVGATVTYSFPQAGAEWIGDYYDAEPFNGFQAFNAGQQQAARNALAVWQEVANITFVEVAETPTVGLVEGNVGDIRFGFSAVVTNDPYAIAWGYFPYSNPGFEFPEAGDVWLDPAYGPNLQMQPGQFGFSTLIHEIGHAIGLDHPFDDGGGEPVLPASMDNNQYTIMAYDPHPTASVEAMSPMLLDILAIQHLYGANMTTRTGNDNYTFSNTTEELRAIWDAGGVDTFDCSNQTLAAKIDLNEGAFSSIGRRNAGGAASNNIAIAYGAAIENAIGGAGNDQIIGNELANIIDGRGGNDTMRGGAGNDTYYVNSTGDVIDEQGNSDVADEIRTTVTINMATLGAGLIENARAWTDAAINITGNAKGNYILGSIAKNTLDGAAGDDILWGNDGNDLIIGGDGNDYLDGGTGNDILRGGKGNDVYLIDSLDDVIDEQGNTDTGDDVRGYISFDLNTLGGGAIDRAILFGSDDLNATGNARANRLAGNSGANVLDGGGGDDLLLGGDGNDTLIGGSGNDWLSGAGGNDSFKGGAGNDSYVVDSPDEIVDEESNTDTGDQIRATFTVDLETYAGGQIEIAVINGGAALDAFGNAAANLLWGNQAANTLDGRGGDDTIIGNGGDDALIGGEGNDWLDGGGGNDEMKGGSGNDRYIVDSAADVIDEEGNTDTADEVRATISVDISVLGGGAIENIVLQGSGAIDATGNASANKIYGNSGNNVLNGGLGDDILLGGAGNDTYVVDSLADVIDEQGNKDTGDEIRTGAFSIVLAGIGAGAIENATLLGADDLDITGTSANNQLIGNAGVNTLIGGDGNDYIDGGGGLDKISGDAGNDRIALRDFIFASIDGGSGNDTLVLIGKGLTMDMAQFAPGQIDGIEAIDLTGTGDNKLVITADDIKALSSTTDRLVVEGNKGDILSITADFHHDGNGLLNGKAYEIWRNGTAEIFVAPLIDVWAPNPGMIDPTDMDSTIGFRIDGAVLDFIGMDTAEIGDINNDGYADFYFSSYAGFSAGHDAFIVYGHNSPSLGTYSISDPLDLELTEILTEQTPTLILSSVGEGGDVNADGVNDLLFGVYSYTFSFGPDAAYIVYGPTLTPGSDYKLPTTSSGSGYVLDAPVLGDHFGIDAQFVGDVNGDGYDDVVVGDYLVFGGKGDVNLKTATVDQAIHFTATNDDFGYAFTVLGDVNADGYDDFAIDDSFNGACYVIFGRKQFGAAEMDLATLSGTNGFKVTGGYRLWDCTGGGDINGDGYSDMVFADSQSALAGTSAGSIAILFGAASGFSPTINLTTLNGSDGFRIQGGQYLELGSAVDISGDVNGDGYADILVGASGPGLGNGTMTGETYLIFGHGGAYASSELITNLGATEAVKYTGGSLGSLTGDSVSFIGDFNGDGLDDFAVGAMQEDYGGSNSGSTYVFYGQDFLQSALTLGTNDADSVFGTGSGDQISTGTGNDIISGNGGADAINGGQGNDEIHVADNKFFRIDGGTGVDTLNLDYSGAIDFGNLDGNAATSDRGRIENLEVIDVANGHANALTLHLADVLDLDVTVSNVGGVAALDNALRIDGEAGDTLQLFSADGWGAADTSSLAGYAIYTYQAVKVAVDTDIVVSVT